MDSETSKINLLIEKFGGWAAVTLIVLVSFMYQQDRASMKAELASTNARIVSAERSIGRLQEGKASRAELKELQESFLREIVGTRQDMKEGFQIIRSDIAQRMEMMKAQK